MTVRSQASYRKRIAARGKSVRERLVLAPGTKRGPDCEQILPEEDFPRSKNQPSGRGSYSKPSHNARSSATRVRLYGSTRHYHLVARYGITAAEADAMVEAQGGVCAACRERPPVHVDHDHTFGNVRGILCFTCNGGLGQFRDRADILATRSTTSRGQRGSGPWSLRASTGSLHRGRQQLVQRLPRASRP